MPNQANMIAIKVTAEARRVRSLLTPRIDDLRPFPLLAGHGTAQRNSSGLCSSGAADGCRHRERTGRADEHGHYRSDRTGNLGTTVPGRSACVLARVFSEPPTRIE